MRALRAAGARVSLDTQFDASELWTGSDGHLRRLLPLLDVLLFNETEGAGIASACVPAQPEDPSSCASTAHSSSHGGDGGGGEGGGGDGGGGAGGGGASGGGEGGGPGTARLGPKRVLEILAAAYPQALVVIKCGADGVLGACGARRWEVGCYPTEVLDTTGAGDAFNAGFLHRYVHQPQPSPVSLTLTFTLTPTLTLTLTLALLPVLQ